MTYLSEAVREFGAVLAVAIGLSLTYSAPTRANPEAPEPKQALSSTLAICNPQLTQCTQGTPVGTFGIEYWLLDPADLELPLVVAVIEDTGDRTPADRRRAPKLTIWGGPMVLSDLDQALILNGELTEESLVGVTFNQAFAELGRRVQLESEGQILGHFGSQGYLEFTGGIGIRWQVADKVSLAFFDGISVATVTPRFESDRPDRDRGNAALNYFALEAEWDLTEQLAVAVRLHHRSGIFGLYNGVRGGSNAYILGIRRRL